MSNDLKFNINCPHCNKNIEITITDIGSTINCPICKKPIQLDNCTSSTELDEVNSAVDDLFNTLNKFN